MLDKDPRLSFTSKLMNSRFRNHYHHEDERLGVSPHVLKMTEYNGKLYEMGKCVISNELTEDGDEFVEAVLAYWKEEMERKKVLFPNTLKLRVAKYIMKRVKELLEGEELEYTVETVRFELTPCNAEILVIIKHFSFGFDKASIEVFTDILKNTDYLSISKRGENCIQLSFRVNDVYFEAREES